MTADTPLLHSNVSPVDNRSAPRSIRSARGLTPNNNNNNNENNNNTGNNAGLTLRALDFNQNLTHRHHTKQKENKENSSFMNNNNNNYGTVNNNNNNDVDTITNSSSSSTLHPHHLGNLNNTPSKNSVENANESVVVPSASASLLFPRAPLSKRNAADINVIESQQQQTNNNNNKAFAKKQQEEVDVEVDDNNIYNDDIVPGTLVPIIESSHHKKENNNNNENENNNNIYEEDNTGILVRKNDNKDNENNGDDENEDDKDSNFTDDDQPDKPLEHHLRVNKLYRSAILCTLPFFAQYATMITLQRSIKNKIGFTDKDKETSLLFGTYVGNIYIGNLIFRLMHNILFSFLVPRQRVMLAYCLAICAHLIIGVSYWVIETKSLAPVFCSYLLCGVAIGTYESNFFSVLSPLGHETKQWGVQGISVGFNGLSIGCYLLFSLAPDTTWLHGGVYFVVAFANLLGLLYFTFGLPYVEHEGSHDNLSKFKDDLLVKYPDWIHKIKHHSVCLFVAMASVSMFSSIVYYIYDDSDIPLWPYAETTINKNVFQTWFNSMSFIGYSLAVKMAYSDHHYRSPYRYLIGSVVGGALVLSKTALLAPFGMFLVMFALGSVYSLTNKHVDNVVDDSLILVALSIFLMVGDIGSYVFSLLVQPIQIWLGTVPMHQYPNMTHLNITNITTTIPKLF